MSHICFAYLFHGMALGAGRGSRAVEATLILIISGVKLLLPVSSACTACAGKGYGPCMTRPEETLSFGWERLWHLALIPPFA